MSHLRIMRSVCTLGVVLSFVSATYADEPEIHRGKEVTAKLQIDQAPLRESRGNEYRLEITLKNQSAEALNGPLLLTIEKTGVESFVLKQHDGRFAKDGKAFLTVLKSGQTLKAKQSVSYKGIRFETLVKPKSDPIDTFELTAKIFELGTQAEPTIAKTEAKIQQQAGLPFPMRGVGTSGNQAGSDTSNIQPEPDPIAGGEPVASDEPRAPVARGGNFTPRPRVPTAAEVAKATAVKDEWSDKLFDVAGVHAVGAGWALDGSAGLTVFVTNFAQKKLIPDQLDGVPVQVLVQDVAELQGPLGTVGFPVHPESGFCFDDPTRVFERPIPIGVSGWNREVNLCATGTLGCRLEDTLDNDDKYILSNSHVLADNGAATIGDLVIQPGPIDFNCTFAPDSVVGSLVDFSNTIITTQDDRNFIDAAIASTSPLFMSTATPCNGYGVPKEETMLPSFGLEVMKYGRTTEFTTGLVNITSINVNIAVGEDIDGDPILARYMNQIGIITDNNFFGSFSAGGDSGSLVVTRDGRNPVGLLFAGSSFITYANRIDVVLGLIGTGTLQVDGEPTPVVLP